MVTSPGMCSFSCIVNNSVESFWYLKSLKNEARKRANDELSFSPS